MSCQCGGDKYDILLLQFFIVSFTYRISMSYFRLQIKAIYMDLKHCFSVNVHNRYTFRSFNWI